jgi:hypothetical protein
MSRFKLAIDKTLFYKCRRWQVQNTGEIVSRDWRPVQSGTHMTEEFAAF